MTVRMTTSYYNLWAEGNPDQSRHDGNTTLLAEVSCLTFSQIST